MSRKKGIFRLLDTVGDLSGETNAIGDYSSTAQSFRISDTKGWGQIERMIIGVEDGGSMDSGSYGNGIALTNGIRVYLKNSSNEVMQEFTAFPIKTNAHWAAHCHDLTLHDFGVGNGLESIRWTFSKSGQPIIVKFDQGEYFEVYLNDNFSGLVNHTFIVQGKYVTQIE